MKYYDLGPNFNDDALSLASDYLSDDADEFEVHETERLNPSYLEQFEFSVCQQGEAEDCLAIDLSWLVVSERFRRVVEAEVGDAAEWIAFPNIQHVLGQRFLLHPLVALSALNLEASDLSWSKNDLGEPYISAIHRLVLDKKWADHAPMFRLKEHTSYIIVNDKVASAIRAARLSGIALTPVSAK